MFKSKIDNHSYIVFMNNFVVDMKFIQIVFDGKKLFGISCASIRCVFYAMRYLNNNYLNELFLERSNVYNNPIIAVFKHL